MSEIDKAERHLKLQKVDWSALPPPQDDGGAAHLEGMVLPSVSLATTGGDNVDFSTLPGTTIIFAYPRTGRPDQDLPDGWDMIPGARGCTPQACTIRDMYSELKSAGADSVFGLSTQDTEYQQEVIDRLHLPYSLVSDVDLDLANALNLPLMTVNGMVLLKRLTLVCINGRLVCAFYPVFPPDQSPQTVLDWLTAN